MTRCFSCKTGFNRKEGGMGRLIKVWHCRSLEELRGEVFHGPRSSSMEEREAEKTRDKTRLSLGETGELDSLKKRSSSGNSTVVGKGRGRRLGCNHRGGT